MYYCLGLRFLLELKLLRIWDRYFGYMTLLPMKNSCLCITFMYLSSKIFNELRKDSEINLLNWKLSLCLLASAKVIALPLVLEFGSHRFNLLLLKEFLRPYDLQTHACKLFWYDNRYHKQFSTILTPI